MSRSARLSDHGWTYDGLQRSGSTMAEAFAQLAEVRGTVAAEIFADIAFAALYGLAGAALLGCAAERLARRGDPYRFSTALLACASWLVLAGSIADLWENFALLAAFDRSRVADADLATWGRAIGAVGAVKTALLAAGLLASTVAAAVALAVGVRSRGAEAVGEDVE